MNLWGRNISLPYVALGAAGVVIVVLLILYFIFFPPKKSFISNDNNIFGLPEHAEVIITGTILANDGIDEEGDFFLRARTKEFGEVRIIYSFPDVSCENKAETDAFSLKLPLERIHATGTIVTSDSVSVCVRNIISEEDEPDIPLPDTEQEDENNDTGEEEATSSLPEIKPEKPLTITPILKTGEAVTVEGILVKQLADTSRYGGVASFDMRTHDGRLVRVVYDGIECNNWKGSKAGYILNKNEEVVLYGEVISNVSTISICPSSSYYITSVTRGDFLENVPETKAPMNLPQCIEKTKPSPHEVDRITKEIIGTVVNVYGIIDPVSIWSNTFLWRETVRRTQLKIGCVIQ